MKSSRKLLSYIFVLLSVVALSSCHSNKNVSRSDYKPGKTPEGLVEFGSERSYDGWDYYSNLIINEAKTWIGTPYKYGGSKKKKGTDCSGMTQQVYMTATGIEIPRNSAHQSEYCDKISNKKVLPGDLIFFNTSGKGVSHVGIYLGNNCMIHASGSKGVMISTLSEPYWQKAYMCCGRVPQLEVLAQNYAPENSKASKKNKEDKKNKEKGKKKNEKDKQEEPIDVSTPESTIPTAVMSSDYAQNASPSGPSPDEYATNHYATNWNETVENSTYTTDYVAKARFKSQPTLPILPVDASSALETASVSTDVQNEQDELEEELTPANVTATENQELAHMDTTAPAQSTQTNSQTGVQTAVQAAPTTNSGLTPPAQHAEIFASYDQYGGTSVTPQPAKPSLPAKDEADKLFLEDGPSHIDNNTEITSISSATNITTDGPQKKAISPAEAFAKRNTSSNTTSSNGAISVPTNKVSPVPATHVVDHEEEEENPWMD